MKITIGYLYYDLMNLYGEIGNIYALEYHLKEQGITPIIKRLSIDDKINFDELDMVYMGSGTEKNRDIVLNDLIKYKDDIKRNIKNNKLFLITGNSYPLFGKKIINSNNQEIDGLGIFDYKEVKHSRIVNEIVKKNNIIKKDIYGFTNHFNDVTGVEHPLFIDEGIKEHNFYGTFIIGPILVRNPLFLIYFIKNLVNSIDHDYKLKEFDTKLNDQAYDEFIKFKETKLHIK